MAEIRFDKCIFSILRNLLIDELRALCDFMHSKVAFLTNELGKVQALIGGIQGMVLDATSRLDAAAFLITNAIRSSPLLGFAKTLGPDCAGIVDAFAGMFAFGDTFKKHSATAERILRKAQTYLSGLTQLKQLVNDAILFLDNLCSIIENTIIKFGLDPAEARFGDSLKGANDIVATSLPGPGTLKIF